MEIEKELQADWDHQLNIIFAGPPPGSAQWTVPNNIVRALNVIAGKTNHVFLPDHGGQDLGACRATADGLMEWTIRNDGFDDMAYLCRPLTLTFWKPGATTRDANFILECGAMESVLDETPSDAFSEETAELVPGEYVPRYHLDQGEYQGQPLPETTRLVIRYLKPGRFAIFGKGSIYNQFRGGGFDAYDAVHNDEATFKRIVEDMAQVPAE